MVTIKECAEKLEQFDGSMAKLHGEVSGIKDGCEGMSQRLGALEQQMTSIFVTLARIEANSLSPGRGDASGNKGNSPPSSFDTSQVTNVLPASTKNSLGYQGISSVVQNRDSMLKKIDMPVFDGRLPYGWISRVERFFRLGQYAEEEKLELIALHLEGSVLNWFYGEMEIAPFSDWSQFKNRFLARFAPVRSCSPREVLMTKELIPEIGQEEESSTETKLLQKTESMDPLPSQIGFVLDDMHSNFGIDDLFVQQQEELFKLHVIKKYALELNSITVKTTPCAYDMFHRMILHGIREKQQREVRKSWKFKFKQRLKTRENLLINGRSTSKLMRNKKIKFSKLWHFKFK